MTLMFSTSPVPARSLIKYLAVSADPTTQLKSLPKPTSAGVTFPFGQGYTALNRLTSASNEPACESAVTAAAADLGPGSALKRFHPRYKPVTTSKPSQKRNDLSVSMAN